MEKPTFENNMKENKNILPAIILAVGFIIAAYLIAFSNRYVIDDSFPYNRIDKWTGETIMIEKQYK